jgi:two-component system LytT family response regulator
VSARLRAVVVDDEPLARDLLRALLARDPEVEVAGDCAGVEAAAAIGRLRADIVFLDVQMPEVDGFGVVAALPPGRAPVVVFVTAYDRYALRAFDVHAVDYLLKPVHEKRFAEALSRAKDVARARRAGAPGDGRLDALLEDHARHTRRFLVRTHEKTVVVDAQDVDWIEAADYYATLHVGPRAHLVRETLTDLARRLDPERFFRVHRSAIVNLDRVREIHPLFRGDAELVLAGGTRVRLSRTRRAEFKKAFAPSGRR